MIEKGRKGAKGQGATASVHADFSSAVEVHSVISSYHSLCLRKRASRGYLEGPNRSYVQKVMTILRTLRSAVKADENLGGNSRNKINWCPNLSHLL